MPVLDVTIAGQPLGVWNIDELSLDECFALKDATGLDPWPIDQGLGRLDAACWRAVVWHLRRKTEPNLRITDVKFKLGDIEADMVREEPEVPTEAGAVKEATSANDETDGSTSSPAGSDTAPVTSAA